MDSSQFDALTRLFAEPASRRSSLRSIAGAAAGGALAFLGLDLTEAGKKGKKKKKKKKKKGQKCGSVTCAAGQVCCPDQKCGTRCCANGRACDVVCSGPNGNDYCCDASRPEPICGGCWQAGSTQCDGYCCSPGQRCCGKPPYDHCCADGWECKIGCGGNPESATCCKVGAATCCDGGVSG